MHMTDRWWGSPHNFQPDIAKLPDEIKIHDTTLREGEEQSCVSYTPAEKVKLIQELDDLGIPRIELGAATAPDALEAIEQVMELSLNADFYVILNPMDMETLRRVLDMGVKHLLFGFMSSEFILKKDGLTLESAYEKTAESCIVARETGAKITLFPSDFTRAPLERSIDQIERLFREKLIDATTIVDSFGVASPHAVEYIIREIKKRINIQFEVHAHNDFGLAMAISLAGLFAGADVVHSSIHGIGYRSGGAATEELVMALSVLYGIDLKIKLEKLCSVSRQIEDVTRLKVQRNKPIVGRELFTTEFAGFIKKFPAPEEERVYQPYLPLTVGNSKKIVLGTWSDVPAVEHHLQMHGIDIGPPEKMNELVGKVNFLALEKKRCLKEEEFAALAREVLGL